MTRTIESFLRRIASSVTILAAILSADPALANFNVTAGSGTTIFAIDGSNQGTSLCASAECPSHVAINTAGAPIGVSGTPWFVTGSGGTFPATLNATPSLANGNGVVPTQGGSVLSATNGLYSNLLQGNVAISATNGIYTNLLQGNAVIGSGNPLFTQVTAGSATMGKVDLLGNAGAILDFAGQNASSPANSVLIGGQFNTTPTTITSGNSSPLQMDASGNLLVSVKAGGGNPAAGATGFAVPSSGDYIGINIGGTLRGQTGVNPSGSVYAGQTDMTSINGVTTVTAASGVQKVGISGNSGVTLDGSIGAGTAPTNALATLGVYNSTPITLTTGQSAALQADANGYLEVNVKAGGGAGGTSSSINATYPATGTAAGAEYLSSPPTLTSGQMVALQTDINGNLKTTVANTNANGQTTMSASSPVTLASDQSAVAVKGNAANGSAVSGNPELIAGSDGTNARTISTNSSGQPVVVGAGTAGTATGGVLTVQGVASMTPVLANPGTAANWGVGATGSAPAANAVLQGAIGGGATGGLVNGLIQADSSAAINVSTATTTQIVALSSGRKVYVTSFDVIAGGAGNITFEYGTGASCGTGTTVLTGAYNLTAQAGIAKGGGLGPVLVIPAGNALCVLTSAAVQMSGSVAYAQF